MKKAFITVFLLIITCPFLHAFLAANPTNHFEISLADSQSLTPAFELQGVFNMSESFYAGIRFTAGRTLYYYSMVSMTSDIEYVLDYSNIALLLGLQSAPFSERFRAYLDIMPGFGFGEKRTGTRPVVNSFSTEIINVTKTEPHTFFAPSVEIGFNCELTDNLIVSAGWNITLIAVSDMAWHHEPWLIKLSETDALHFSIPLRLSWRF